MVLKTLTHDKGKSDEWNYYDNISSATARYDEELDMAVVDVTFKDDSGNLSCTIALNDIAYLLSDSGKTIERLRPAKKPEHILTANVKAKLESVEVE